jgi:hypothetical protein
VANAWCGAYSVCERLSVFYVVVDSVAVRKFGANVVALQC